MGRTKEDYIALLEETANYYTSKNRGYDNVKGCVYSDSKGNKCAVGRCLIDAIDFERRVQEGEFSSTSVDCLFSDKVFSENELKEEYRGYHLRFWEHIQMLHDGYANWDDTGLTESGKECVDNIRSLINYNYMSWVEDNTYWDDEN